MKHRHKYITDEEIYFKKIDSDIKIYKINVNSGNDKLFKSKFLYYYRLYLDSKNTLYSGISDGVYDVSDLNVVERFLKDNVQIKIQEVDYQKHYWFVVELWEWTTIKLGSRYRLNLKLNGRDVKNFSVILLKKS